MFDHQFDYDDLYVVFLVVCHVLSDKNKSIGKKELYEFLPAARSSSPVRSVVGLFRAVGGVNNDSAFEEIDFTKFKIRNIILKKITYRNIR